ncbi:MAG TPA: SDR family oxidoreductase, partial [Casimicrobiaceae bacterium]
RGGAIVNVSSAASRLGSAGEYVDYAASKGAVDSLTIGLSREVAAEGIRVNAVRPAFIHTDIHASGGEPGRIDRIKDSIPMRRGGRGGAIVNVSSAASRLGSAGEYVEYAASKGAVDSLTIGLSREVAAEGIRVNAVRPAFIHTDIHASGGEPGRIDRIKDSIPMRRGGQPEEVANAILWLLSDEASYVTGTFVDLAGGK